MSCFYTSKQEKGRSISTSTRSAARILAQAALFQDDYSDHVMRISKTICQPTTVEIFFQNSKLVTSFLKVNTTLKRPFAAL